MNTISISNFVIPVVTSCGFRIASSPFYHANRTVDFNILIYVTAGVIYVTEDDTDYAIKSGELLFLKNGIHHYGRCEIEKGTEWYYAHFIYDEQMSQEYIPDSTPIVQYDNMYFSKRLPKKMNGLIGSVLEKKIMDFSDYYNSNDDMNIWNSGIKFFDVLTEAAFIQPNHKFTVADKIAEYLTINFSYPFDAQQISSKFYLSYKHLAAVFKGEKGMSMKKFHNKIRMNEACRLLTSTVLPIGEIAEYVGFSDILYFSRCFSDYTGVCPTEYRKIHSTY